jgi:hypothetical protein
MMHIVGVAEITRDVNSNVTGEVLENKAPSTISIAPR